MLNVSVLCRVGELVTSPIWRSSRLPSTNSEVSGFLVSQSNTRGEEFLVETQDNVGQCRLLYFLMPLATTPPVKDFRLLDCFDPLRMFLCIRYVVIPSSPRRLLHLDFSIQECTWYARLGCLSRLVKYEGKQRRWGSSCIACTSYDVCCWGMLLLRCGSPDMWYRYTCGRKTGLLEQDVQLIWYHFIQNSICVTPCNFFFCVLFLRRWVWVVGCPSLVLPMRAAGYGTHLAPAPGAACVLLVQTMLPIWKQSRQRFFGQRRRSTAVS